jgi:hypothetical protein
MRIKPLAFLIFLGLILIALGFYFNSSFNHQEKIQENFLSQTEGVKGYYQNSLYNYLLTYPEAWFLGFAGSSLQAADEVWLVANIDDINLENGGIPKGIKVKINIHNLDALKAVDSQFKNISSLEDWLAWQRSSSNVSFKDEVISFNNIKAVKTSYIQPVLKNLGPGISITFFNPEKTHVFQINYLGSNKDYYLHIKNFESIIASFQFI